MQWIIDGMNVIGSRPDGWWRDRPAARRRLVAELAPWAGGQDGPVTVVFDGRPQPGEIAEAQIAGVAVEFAPGGPDAADDAIAAMVSSLEAPREAVVVTSDSGLRRRVAANGVKVTGASAWRSALGRRGAPPSER